MSEYIEREVVNKIIEEIEHGCKSNDFAAAAVHGVKVEISRLPSHCIVSVVRCSECEHFYPFFDPPYGKCSRRHHDDEVVKYMDYCSYAEKKTAASRV